MLQLASSLDAAAVGAGKQAPKFTLKKPPKDFAFVGVTNRPDLIDPALLRRFARVVTLGPPDFEERVSILTSLLRAGGIQDGLDVRSAASRTEGWTRGDLRSVVDDVVRMAAGGPTAPADLETALEERSRVIGLVRVG
jgi:SpoVK/Ycf46/Vps4 family AAA+-type ATPase